ncbi:MAG: cation:proton antiporter [Candidatus Rokubacteria bacterium]|nr:cation:proton antiporter [Candidatus Rokubacteria bacterium]
MIREHDSVIVRTGARMLVPPIQIFALYVVIHGHGSPGGGFQGGLILAASYILIGLTLGRQELRRRAREGVLLALACLGVLVFALTGVATLALGGALLDYTALPFPGGGTAARSLGILVIEIGVAIGVAGTLTLIFCRLAKAGEGEEAP